jgi:hypothetical protein
MNADNLTNMSDAELVSRLEALVRDTRRLTVAVLLHIGEVEARGLHHRAACPSMYIYCTKVLRMSEDEAFKRIRAARAVRRHPVLAAAMADGRLHQTAVVLLAPHLTDANADELVVEASGKSKAEIEILLARLSPRVDVPARLERMVEPVLRIVPGDQPDSGEVVLEPPRDVANKLTPLAPERFALQLTICGATRMKLLRAQALLRHQVPSGDLSEVLDRALDALLDKVEARRFGKVKTPRPAKGSRGKRHVPSDARRLAVARDGLRCSFVSDDGTRCEETGFLELDHVVPVALGGKPGDGVRVLCRSHNQFEAERLLGRDLVRAGKTAKAARADKAVTSGQRSRAVTAARAGTGAKTGEAATAGNAVKTGEAAPAGKRGRTGKVVRARKAVKASDRDAGRAAGGGRLGQRKAGEASRGRVGAEEPIPASLR